MQGQLGYSALHKSQRKALTLSAIPTAMRYSYAFQVKLCCRSSAQHSEASTAKFSI